MNDLSIKLEICPFCGGKGIVTEKPELGMWRVECENRWDDCPMNMRTHHHETIGEAVNAWNTRGDKLVIFSEAVCFNLNAAQHDGRFHPYTCGNDSMHRPLIATSSGWMCADCGYKQDWYHKGSIN